ncbi:M1-specific T cell receptor alpha chain-like [Paramormyrops kingsleyae]|uniref:M1-specific T cell receptor alpha chain-like n=1 Tax=Paramormyrops kingsleyae TaxID=1676925 RepID=UPI003B97491A
MVFGSGTKLIVQQDQSAELSFYKLGEGNNTVCMATGFSKYSALDKEETFSKYKTVPTRIKDEPFFDKVVILEEGDTCPNSTDEDGKPCNLDFEGTFETDEKINFLSLTVLGLRFLFLKSILFNVLMTIRALSS